MRRIRIVDAAAARAFNAPMAEPPRFTHRTVVLDPPPQERELARALFGVLNKGIHDLPGIVAALNETQVRPASGGAWTEAGFTAEMERLGAYPNSVGGTVGSHAAGVALPGTSSSERLNAK
jgi:hypothetical protein